MNKLSNILGAALVTFTFNVYAGSPAALSGNYSIGKKGADYSSISAAVKALESSKLSGPVHFMIQDGIYNEPVSIASIKGVDALHPVSFASQSGRRDAVVISYDRGDATVAMNGSQWIAFENLTIAHKDAPAGSCVKIDGQAAHISFKGVVFNGVEKVSADNSPVIFMSLHAPKSYMAFEDCEINNGSTGISKSGMSADASDNHTSIVGSVFFNQSVCGIALSHEDAPIVSSNVISSLSNEAGFKAISMNDVKNSMVISNNIINTAKGSYGISLNDCMAKATDYSQVLNNSVTVGGIKTIGIYLAGHTDNIAMSNNRIKLDIAGKQTAAQSYYKNDGDGSNVVMMDNVLYDLHTGGYTIIGNTYKDAFNQLPGQANSLLVANANGMLIEKVSPMK